MYRSRLRDSSTIRRSGTASVESCSWWTATAAGTYRLRQPASPQPPSEVDLVGVDEEVGVQVVDLRGGLAPHEQRRRLAPVDLAGRREPRLCTTSEPCSHSAPASAVSGAGKPPRRGLRRAVGPRAARAPAQRRRAVGLERLAQRQRRPGQQLGVLVEQQRVAAARAAQQLGVVEPLAAPRRAGRSSRRRPGAPRAACAEPSREPLSSTSTSVANGSPSRSRAIASRPRSSSSRWEVLTTQ